MRKPGQDLRRLRGLIAAQFVRSLRWGVVVLLMLIIAGYVLHGAAEASLVA